MEVTEIINIIMLIVPWIVAIVLGIIVYVKSGKVIDITATAEKAQTVLKEVLAFFDSATPMSETSLDTIQNVIPATTYKMTEESCNRILATCKDEEEKTRINDLIVAYENPQVEGDECCVYTIETSGAVFQVSYGVPELIETKTATYC